MQIKVVMQGHVSPVDVDTPVVQAQALMEGHGLRHLPVTEDGAVAGLVSERALRRVQPSTLPELGAWELPPDRELIRVREVMTPPPPGVTPDTDVAQAASLLVSSRAEALPVVDGRDVVGVVSVRDLLGVLADGVDRPRRPRLGHILAAVDDEAGAQALATAVALARHHGARLTLAWVLPPLPRRAIVDVWPALWEQVGRERTRAARAWLAARVGETADGLAVELVVTEGRTADEVLALAEQRESDLVVVDAGSAESLAVEAPCPVLGVPAGRSSHASR
jgi:CBS domain-containing protein/nucleotide-binding universal stress UspA family protein